jgi:uncharacterized membrane protein YagU involved in acid resistance
MNKSNVKTGMWSGLVAGIVFGVMMSIMNMLPAVARLFSSDSNFIGFIVHIIFSLIIGIIFAFVFDKRIKSNSLGIIYGLVYGVVWWIVGSLIVMPAWLGLGVQLSGAGISNATPSLWGHLVFGFVLGFVYILIKRPVNS